MLLTNVQSKAKRFVLSVFLVLSLGCAMVSCLKRDSYRRMESVSRAILAEQIDPPPSYCRADPLFTREGLRTPLLFAHRGGVLEAPESTQRAFRQAVETGADVLELDVQLTRDGRIVVWHGPSLKNVRIEGEPLDPRRRPEGRRDIHHFPWQALERAWVADPGTVLLSNVPTDEKDRKLLLLAEFLSMFPRMPLNIELKGTFNEKLGNGNGLEDNISAFLKILDAGKGDRTVIVASASHKILTAFRNLSGEKYPTNLSPREQFLLRFKKSYENRALETVYHPRYSNADIIRRVRQGGGASYVFLTGIMIYPSIDREPDKEEIFKILDRGVDGIMTDRPGALGPVLEEWKSLRCP